MISLNSYSRTAAFGRSRQQEEEEEEEEVEEQVEVDEEEEDEEQEEDMEDDDDLPDMKSAKDKKRNPFLNLKPKTGWCNSLFLFLRGQKFYRNVLEHLRPTVQIILHF